MLDLNPYKYNLEISILENLLNDTFDYDKIITTVSNQKSLLGRITSNIFSTNLSNHCYKLSGYYVRLKGTCIQQQIFAR